MRKFLIVAALLVGVALGWGVVQAQTQTWYIVQNPYGIHITAGTVFPSLTSELGMNPADGSMHIDLNGATANPTLSIYSAFTTSWIPVSPISGTGQIPSTLATNAVDAANSIWGGTGELIFEGATADAFENEIRTADATVGVATFLLPDNAAAADIYPIVFSQLATNALDAANSIWMVSNGIHFEGATANDFENSIQSADVGQDQIVYMGDYGEAATSAIHSTVDDMDLGTADGAWFGASQLVFEGATANAFETVLTVADPTVGVGTFQFPDYGLAADTYLVHSTPDGSLTTGYWTIPPPFSHTEDAVVDFTAGDNALYVYRVFIGAPLTVSDASVLLVDGGALAAADIVGVALYRDADAGVQLSTGTGDGTAAGLETIALSDSTVQPGWYRLGVCSSDATNLHLHGTLQDDETIDVISAVAGDITFGTGANPCVAGVPPATTGALTTADENIPVLMLH